MPKKSPCFSIGNRAIGPQCDPYFIADLSSNHQQCIEQARALIKYAKISGADAVQVQTYTADTLTLPIRNEQFEVDVPWKVKHLYDLYKISYTPWEWHEELAEYAKMQNITFLCTPFDETAGDFLETHVNPPAYKIPSLEITHLPLLKKVASTAKPVILSTGWANLNEIKEAITTLQDNGCKHWMLLKHVELPVRNLRTITYLQKQFKCSVGISDHTPSINIALGSISLGASLIEKHFILNRQGDAVENILSLEPNEFRLMVNTGKELYKGLGEEEIENYEGHRYRCSIYVSKPIECGEQFTKDNLKIIRPSFGLAPKYWESVLGQYAKNKLDIGHPLSAKDIIGFVP